ncbi:MAG: hypothetical protein RIC30_10290 [Marinoscillum sp.]|uniref:hypothetical protein n=1 Tax=Marinoscillum sp. TaxID=2024838 RepID=UPI0032FDF78A
MELTITGIGDKGNLANERIGLKAIKDCELKFYQLFRTEFFDAGGFSNRSKSSYWFAPKKVKAGDKIIIYTKHGTDNFEIKEDGSTIHWYYWGLDQPIFINDKHGVVLVEINNWQMSKDK